MKKSWGKPILIILSWLVSILLIGLWSIKYLPFSPSFPYYGDLSSHYSRALASFAHFDGIHYLRLVYHAYTDMGSQAFFPAYPLLVRTLTFGVFDPLYIAIILNFSLLLATFKLVKASPRFLLLFLTFPTSFFLLANYTESLFVFFVVLFFTFLRQKRFFWAALVAGLASGTRVVGIFLAASLLIELLQSRQNWWRIGSYLLLTSAGLFGYMLFLTLRYHNPLMFVHVQTMFGAGRSGSTIILLPQVLYRYAHMLATTPPTSLGFIRSAWELLTFLLACLALALSWRRLRLSAAIFCACVILFPSLSGTLSSFPRYALVAIPLFIAFSQSLSGKWLALISALQYVMLIISVAWFVQGIFVA
jgi:hypothetical protein